MGVNTEFTGGNNIFVPQNTEQGAQVQQGVVQVAATVADSITFAVSAGQLNPSQETLNGLNAGNPVVEFAVAYDTTGAVSSAQVNMWFSPNMMVALSINLTEMQKQLTESRAAEIGAKVEAMNMIWDFSQNMANAIIQAGQIESQMHMMEGVAGVMTAAGGVMGVGLAGANAHAVVNSTPGNTKWPGLQSFMSSGGGTALNSVMNGLGQAVTGFIKSSLVLEKAEWEAEKEIQSALKQLYSQILSSAQQSDQELLELVKKALDMMKQVFEANARAHNSFMPRS
ncbi:hypothetical protein [Estrella lausannensis]|uniref:Uncharacterized protein n=1 Tax=Estrella lausannensis TaxID=483423 RepID=A0A0H5DNH2_9BACT|nr:hypothetical protein [Estrella lausannensis]CRX37757.1 hypothetical protein ELAC_0396 [Estrella lausannensis]